MERIPLQKQRKSAVCCPHASNGFRLIVMCFGIFSSSIAIALLSQIYIGVSELAPKGAVATDSKTCSSIGIRILKHGGSAVDAAIAGTVCMAVIHPHVTGPGGGGFMLVYDHTSDDAPKVIDFRELVINSSGALPFVIPGFFRGLWTAHKKYGNLPWKDLIAPSVEIASNSEPTQYLKESLKNVASKKIQELPVFASVLNGHSLVQSDMARTLQFIADNGVEDFYAGKLANELVSFAKEKGGNWSLEDLRKYESPVREALGTNFGSMTVYTAGAPTSGSQLLSALNVLRESRTENLSSVQQFHLLIEAFQRLQMHLIKISDPSLPGVVDAENILLNVSFAQKLAQDIVNGANYTYEPIPFLPEAAGAVVSVMDSDDFYTTVVSGLGTWFGNSLMTPHGYLLGATFSNVSDNIPTAHRPLSLYTPVLAVETNRTCGKRLVSGAVDPGTVAQNLLHLYVEQKGLPESVETPRLYLRYASTVLDYEGDPPKLTPAAAGSEPGDGSWQVLLESLKRLGHALQPQARPYAALNLVHQIKDSLASHSDSRAGGFAMKYGP